MRRISLQRYGPLTVTPDTAKKLEKLEDSAKEFGFRIGYEQPSREDETPSELSLISAGRSFRVNVQFPEKRLREHELAALWSVVVPLKITPHNRDPVPGHKDDWFHFLGPWRVLYESMIAEGRGHLAWSSVCIAAQVDVGVWRGDRTTERFVQAQLHRIGMHCGPVDGRIGPRTSSVIRSLGVHGADLQTLAKDLIQRSTVSRKKEKRTFGHIVIPDRDFEVSAWGGIQSAEIPNGVTLSIEGPGRVVVEVGDPKA